MMAMLGNSGNWSWKWAALGGLVLLAAGCERNNYALRLTPQDGKLQRELKLTRTTSDSKNPELRTAKPEELAELVKTYGKELPGEVAGEHAFAKTYRGKAPDDIGNAGWYLKLESPLGHVHGYVEEFRGSDDWHTELQARLAALDQLAVHLTAWLKIELADDPKWPTLKKFLEEDFQKDLRNLGLYVFFHTIHLDGDDSRENDQLAVYCAEYLARHEYLDPEQLPFLFRAVDDIERGESARICGWVQDLLAKRMGYAKGKAPPQSFDFLADPEAMQKSLDNYLKTTKRFAELVKAWEAKKLKDPAAPEPTPQDVVGEFLMEAFLPAFRLDPADRLGVELAAGLKPYSTNGQWDSEAKVVRWRKQIPPRASAQHERQQLLFAFWSEPAEEVQRARFGRTLLDGEDLAQYCLWYQGLTPAERKEWDKFMGELRPTIPLVDRLDRFHFAKEQDAVPGSPPHQNQLAETPRRLLKEKLTPPEEP